MWLFLEKEQNCEYEILRESIYVFRMRKEIIKKL